MALTNQAAFNIKWFPVYLPNTYTSNIFTLSSAYQVIRRRKSHKKNHFAAHAYKYTAYENIPVSK